MEEDLSSPVQRREPDDCQEVYGKENSPVTASFQDFVRAAPPASPKPRQGESSPYPISILSLLMRRRIDLAMNFLYLQLGLRVRFTPPTTSLLPSPVPACRPRPLPLRPLSHCPTSNPQ